MQPWKVVDSTLLYYPWPWFDWQSLQLPTVKPLLHEGIDDIKQDSLFLEPFLCKAAAAPKNRLNRRRGLGQDDGFNRINGVGVIGANNVVAGT